MNMSLTRRSAIVLTLVGSGSVAVDLSAVAALAVTAVVVTPAALALPLATSAVVPTTSLGTVKRKP